MPGLHTTAIFCSCQFLIFDSKRTLPWSSSLLSSLLSLCMPLLVLLVLVRSVVVPFDLACSRSLSLYRCVGAVCLPPPWRLQFISANNTPTSFSPHSFHQCGACLLGCLIRMYSLIELIHYYYYYYYYYKIYIAHKFKRARIRGAGV